MSDNNDHGIANLPDDIDIDEAERRLHHVYDELDRISEYCFIYNDEVMNSISLGYHFFLKP